MVRRNRVRIRRLRLSRRILGRYRMLVRWCLVRLNVVIGVFVARVRLAKFLGSWRMVLERST